MCALHRMIGSKHMPGSAMDDACMTQLDFGSFWPHSRWRRAASRVIVVVRTCKHNWFVSYELCLLACDARYNNWLR
jgi:hypothetical protein